MKKAMLLMIAAMLLTCTAACTNEGTGSVTETQATTEATETTTEEMTEETTEETTEEVTEEITEEATQETEAETEAGSEDATEEQQGGAAAGDTLGQTLLADFQAKAADESMNCQILADEILKNPAIQFGPATMPVEPGLLTGFDNAEIKGFKEGVMFAPMIGSIAFVGYVFELEEGTDAAAFMQTLKDNANPRWNICVEAEETVVEQVGNKVFFLMCPKAIEG